MAHDPQMLKGVLGLLLLNLVGEQEDYGYSIVLRLQRRGFAALTEGTVYPALSRLESNGLLGSRLGRSSSGPARKYYTLTDAGRTELARGSRSWHALVAAVAQVLPPHEATHPRTPPLPDPGPQGESQ